MCNVLTVLLFFFAFDVFTFFSYCFDGLVSIFHDIIIDAPNKLRFVIQFFPRVHSPSMFLLHLLFYLYTTRLSINPFHHHYNKYNKFKIFIFIILSSISCSLSLSCYSLQIRIWFGFCFLSKRLFICCVFHHPFLFLSWSVYALNMIINFNYLNYLLLCH